MIRAGLVFCYSKENRYSLNVLLGALERAVERLGLPSLPYYHLKPNELSLAIPELSKKHDPVIILFSFFTTQIFELYPLIRGLRGRFHKENLILLAGGPHPTGDPFGTLLAGFDCVFLSEAEESLPKFLKHLLRGDPVRDLRGIAYFEGGRFKSNGRPPQVDLNKFPPFALGAGLINPIEITRGCPFACSYCQTPQIFGLRVRHRAPELVLQFVEALLAQGVRDLRFISPNAFSYLSADGRRLNLDGLRGFLKDLKGLVSRKGGKVFFGTFPSEVRPEHTTEETVSLVKEFCHNDSLVIGAQSGSERVLKLCHREHGVEEVLRAVKVSLRFGLTPKVDFIFGLPGEEEEDVRQTVDLMKRLTKMGAVIHAHTFMPLPQTAFQNQRAGCISKEVWLAIKELLPKGKLFGSWERQMHLAKKIEGYLKKVTQKRKEPLNLNHAEPLV